MRTQTTGYSPPCDLWHVIAYACMRVLTPPAVENSTASSRFWNFTRRMCEAWRSRSLTLSSLETSISISAIADVKSSMLKSISSAMCAAAISPIASPLNFGFGMMDSRTPIMPFVRPISLSFCVTITLSPTANVLCLKPAVIIVRGLTVKPSTCCGGLKNVMKRSFRFSWPSMSLFCGTMMASRSGSNLPARESF